MFPLNNTTQLLNSYSNLYFNRVNNFIDSLFLDLYFADDSKTFWLSSEKLTDTLKYIAYHDSINYFLYNNIVSGYYTIDFYLIIPEIFLFFNLLLIFFFLTIFNFKNKINVSVFLSFFLIFFSIFLFINNISYNFDLFFSTFTFSYYIFITKIFILSLSSIFLIFILNYLKLEKIRTFEYIFIFDLIIFSLVLLVSANDFISFFLCLELQSLGLYLLSAYKTNSTFSTEAGIKYFILGAIASGLILFGISLIYGITGSTNFCEILKFNINNSILDLVYIPTPFIYLDFNLDLPHLVDLIFNLFNYYIYPIFYLSIYSIFFIALLFILVGLFFKLGVVPFHMWLPDVYEGSSTITTAFFATIPKASLIFFLLRFIDLFFNQIGDWYLIFILSAILSIFIGTFGAIFQFKIKRLIAYSAIGHIGFIILGLSSFTYINYIASVFYIFIYVSLNLGFFAILIALRKHNWLEIKTIFDLSVLSKNNKILSVFLALNLFSIAGIPPLMGFFSKLFILNVLILNEFFFSTFIILILSVIGVFYYIRLIKILFFDLNSNFIFLKKPSKSLSIIIVNLSLLNLLFFFFPNIFFIEITKIILLF